MPRPATPPGLAAAMVMDCGGGELGVAVEVADHVHADALVEDFCSSSGSEMFSTTNWVSSRPSAAKAGLICVDDLVAERGLVGGHVEEGDVAGGEDVGHARDDGVAELVFEIGDVVARGCR